MTAPVIDRRGAGSAVAGGLLLAASVAGELLHPVQAPDGSVLQAVPFAGYLAAWIAGAALLTRAAVGLAGTSRAARTGRMLSVSGFALLLLFGLVALVTGMLGRPLEASFLAFGLGLLLVAAGALTTGMASRRDGWPLLIAGGGALVALLLEPWHDLGLFVLFGSWVVLGLVVLRRTRRAVTAGIAVG